MAATTREALRDTAAANGWEIDEASPLSDTFRRGAAEVAVRFNVRGGIVLAAERKDPAHRYLSELPGPGKAAVVRDRLTAPR